ncbi:MFS transporter [Streptomyces sp. WC2508]|uniref:MFS transporter n=1 Tax=Streptomyces sp. WC2508 TaxID=3461405 RepID=UPI004043EC6B
MSTEERPDGTSGGAFREVTDGKGRVYRVGESDRDLLGHSRRLMVYLPWISMMAISVSEYAYGSAEDTLSEAHGWTQSNTFWILSVWVFFQAGVAFPAGWLRERGLLTARRAMFAGAALCLVGFVALSHPRGAGPHSAGPAKNPPAVKQYTPKEAVRTGVLPLMWLTVVLTAGVSIFGISFQVDFAEEVGFGPLVAASSMGIMSVINGVGRAVVGWLSDLWGRKRTLLFVIVVLGLAQFGVIWAGHARNEWLFLFFAFLSGFGGGAFYPMFAALTPDYFGENHNATNYGLVYSGKLVSGLFGGGLGSMVVDAWGYDGAYALAGGISMVAACITLMLRQPGNPEHGRRRPSSPVAGRAVVGGRS